MQMHVLNGPSCAASAWRDTCVNALDKVILQPLSRTFVA